MDRLMMYLTNNSYSEVLLFPQMRPEKKQVKIELEEDEIDCFITNKTITKWNLAH
jgi:vacuolar-type H+-ATPase subunit D/Vma8